MKIVLAVVVAIVLIGAAGFGGYTMGHSAGLSDAQNVRNEFFQQRSGQGGGNGQFAQGQGGQGGQNGQFARRPAAFGTVKSVQGNTIELTAADGSTVTVSTSAQTTVQKTVAGAVSDIKPGYRVSVVGSQSGGSVTATEISIQSTGQ